MDGAAFGTRVLQAVGVLCVVLLAADFVFERHGQLSFDNWIGFRAAFGFAACVALVWLAAPLQRWLGRAEDDDA